MQASVRILQSAADIEAGVKALCRHCPAMRQIHRLTGPPPLRREPAGFEGLARIVVAQQVSAASARAIWARTRGALRSVSAGTIARADDEVLRAAGLSAGKIRTLRAAAAAALDGTLDFDRLTEASDEDVHVALTAIHGIGPWSADIYTMFCLGRADAWACRDLALQLSMARLFKLRSRPSAQETLQIAERWRPWRAVAARMLWSFHAVPERLPERTSTSRKSSDAAET